jgi:hypothetical protein
MSILLIDLHQIFFANLMMPKRGVTLDENFFRHLVLNSIRANRVKFKEYEEVVIATDSWSWRRNVFPFYKANRKLSRDNSTTIDWKSIFASLSKIREEIKEHFPYKVIHVEGAEADDIISWVCREFREKKILILSGDKDFVQLQSLKGVKQYDPIRKKFLTDPDPQKFLYEHILRGDSGDGIPNVLSDDDTFVSPDKRQIPLTKKKIKELSMIDIQSLPNYNRNKELIDLTFTPIDITAKIYCDYQNQEGKKANNLFNYFFEKRLKNLMEDIQDFT